ncbi:MAG: hypothetical protein WDO68_08165 [Gammaproteobacteria bacterium]
MKRGFWIARGVKILVIVAVVLGVLTFVVMSLWNWLVPALFGGPLLDYWKALGLLVLARLLFGGLRPHGRGPWGRSWHHARARWERMTPEERERLRSRFHGCHRGGWHGRDDSEGEKNGGSNA